MVSLVNSKLPQSFQILKAGVSRGGVKTTLKGIYVTNPS